MQKASFPQALAVERGQGLGESFFDRLGLCLRDVGLFLDLEQFGMRGQKREIPISAHAQLSV